MIYPIEITYPNISYLNIWLWYGIGMWYGIVYWDNDMIPIRLWYGIGMWYYWNHMGNMICDGIYPIDMWSIFFPSEKPDISHSHSSFQMSNIFNHVTNDQHMKIPITNMKIGMVKYITINMSSYQWPKGMSFLLITHDFFNHAQLFFVRRTTACVKFRIHILHRWIPKPGLLPRMTQPIG